MEIIIVAEKKHKLVAEKKYSLVSSFVRDKDRSKSFYNKLSGDNKVFTRTPIGSILQYIELLTGKRIKPEPSGKYGTENFDYYKFELPVSECGKWLLIENPLSDTK